MTTVLLFHHAQGLTPGVRDLAAALESAGHTVHVPDLYDGRTFTDLEAGVAHAGGIGFETVAERGVAAAGPLPSDVVYAGVSLGVIPAQRLAQTRPGARGALLLEAFVPPATFGEWPAGVPAQVHGMDRDPFFAGDGDVDAAREFVASTPDAQVFLYPGTQHLFTDPSLPSYDAGAAELVIERMKKFLGRL
jgi:dienelactone hydrolase